VTASGTSISEQLAAAFARAPATLPAGIAATCDALLVDVAGLCVAARNQDYVQAALRASGESGTCTLVGHAGGFNVATAALCNGIAAHGEDYDDTFEGGPVHAGAVIVPALLATANSTASPEPISRGLAVGCELMCRLCLVAPKRVRAGFHPTAVFSALGAAAGVATTLHPTKDSGRRARHRGQHGVGHHQYLAEGT
jgi:2-methylcitrate dehydratase PrpD